LIYSIENRGNPWRSLIFINVFFKSQESLCSFDFFQTAPRKSAEFLNFNQSFLFKGDSEKGREAEDGTGRDGPRAAIG